MLTILGFSSTFTFMACYAPPPGDTDYIDVSEEELKFPAAGGCRSVVVVTETEWHFLNDKNYFLYVSPTSGKGPAILTVNVEPNNNANLREAYIFLYIDGMLSNTNPCRIRVIQDGNAQVQAVAKDSTTNGIVY